MLRQHTFVSTLFALALTGAIVAQTGPDQQPRSPQTEDRPERGVIDSRAADLIRGVSQHIAKQDNFTVRLAQVIEVRPPERAEPDAIQQGFTHSMAYTLAFERPNRMRIEPLDRATEGVIVSDGDSLFIDLPALNRYIKRDTPDDLRGLLLDERGIGTGLGGPVSLIAPFLVRDAIDGEAGFIHSASHIGTEEIDGIMAHRLRLVVRLPEELNLTGSPASQWQPNGVRPARPAARQMHYDVWIEERDDAAILRRAQPDLARMMEIVMQGDQTPEPPADVSFSMRIALDEWAFGTEISEERFTFTPPEGAERAESLFQALVAAAAERPQHPLVGEPAPRFELQRLIGTQMELAEHVGEDIVILDFWATWCTPCVRAMPHLISVAEEFRDQNVVLYAVNLREDFDTVHEFINEQGWNDLMVPMDIDGRVAELYSVQAIPQTVIIDREGIVQAVHIGFAPGMDERLRNELQTLVEGRSLIEKDNGSDSNNDEQNNPQRDSNPLQESNAQNEPERAQQIDPEAVALIQKVNEQIERAENFTARLVYTFEMSGPGVGEDDNAVRQRAVYDVAFEKPNLMRLEVVEGDHKETVISDGETLSVHVEATNRYAERAAPADFENLLEFPGAYGAPGGLGGPLTFVSMILNPQEIQDALDQGVLTRVTRVGTATIEGDATQRISMVISVPQNLHEPPPDLPEGAPAPPPEPRAVTDVAFDVWIEEREDYAVLRRMHMDFARMMAMEEAAAPVLEDFTIDIVTEMHEWKFDAEIPEDRFEFSPPEDAQQVATVRETIEGAQSPDSFFELLMRAMMHNMGAEAPRPDQPAGAQPRDERPDPRALVGDEAPAFELQLLDGSQMELIRHRGHDIVILDFWATWCGPCVRALPHLMEVAEEFRDRNVVFYAVSVRESHETVRKFLDERGWDVRVPMDTDRRVATLYRVRGIPQTVIIDREGVIQAVHVGFRPGMEEQLRREVQTLLDGGSLIEREGGPP